MLVVVDTLSYYLASFQASPLNWKKQILQINTTGLKSCNWWEAEVPVVITILVIVQKNGWVVTCSLLLFSSLIWFIQDGCSWSHTKITSLSCHNPSNRRCWAQEQINFFSSLLESCCLLLVLLIILWPIFRDNYVLYHGKLYCCSLVTNWVAWETERASWFVIMCAIFFCKEHREHTILLSRERVNKGTKRMNSLPLSPVVISFILHDFTGKTAAYKSCVTL